VTRLTKSPTPRSAAAPRRREWILTLTFDAGLDGARQGPCRPGFHGRPPPLWDRPSSCAELSGAPMAPRLRRANDGGGDTAIRLAALLSPTSSRRIVEGINTWRPRFGWRGENIRPRDRASAYSTIQCWRYTDKIGMAAEPDDIAASSGASRSSAWVPWPPPEARRQEDGRSKAVAVVRGTLVDKALASAPTSPRRVSVKSILAGVVRQRFAAVGDFVKRGQPLLEISPIRRRWRWWSCAARGAARDRAQKSRARAARQQELRNRNLISPSDIETAQRRVDESRNSSRWRRRASRCRKGGKVLTGGSRWKRWSVPHRRLHPRGLDRDRRSGVPLTPYQAGTVLMPAGRDAGPDLSRPVDEIDVEPAQGGHAGDHQDRRAPGPSVKATRRRSGSRRTSRSRRRSSRSRSR